MRFAAPLIAAMLTAPASAGALEDCEQSQSNTPAVADCLRQKQTDASRRLLAQEGKTLADMHALDAVTDSRFHAARELRQAQQAYETYRRQQCDWVAASYASGNGADRARLACQIDLDMQRLTELSRHRR
ncbi:lysozyme inhibitor LprI family protein [Chromobacterium alticapitis]|uniref:Lysozyme inhibitor LprI-like N-terminal domain-containing protein n=1 Tax=Chromobacterium alticapitis TaxID=2073169 RepID=A0A2S5DF21_9NEIS|nr:lysozyme inhibitor LprI family protein [Chromobacterium alticapitis]POZ61705.1 hypothetical protein C2I19_12395 [Chromobacterium alticapitis]